MLNIACLVCGHVGAPARPGGEVHMHYFMFSVSRRIWRSVFRNFFIHIEMFQSRRSQLYPLVRSGLLFSLEYVKHINMNLKHVRDCQDFSMAILAADH